MKPPRRPPPDALLALVVLGAAALAFALRLHRLADGNVWWDEGYSIYLARQSLLALALETAGDVHPPLHYWLLHVWIRLAGEAEYAVRYTSVWLAVASVPLVYWLGRRTLGRGPGVVAALLLATSRLHVEWSQQIRMYTLVTALTMLSVAVTLRLWERPRRRLWLAHLALTTVGLYTMYLSGLVPLVESLATVLLWLLPLGGRRLSTGFVARWVGVQAAALALFAPWLWLFLRAPHATPKLIYPIDLWTFAWASATAFPLGVSAYLERYTLPTLAALGLLLLAAPAVLRPDRQRAGLLLALQLPVPPLVVYALSLPNPVLYAPNLSVRYLLIFLPAYHLLLGAALGWLWGLGRAGAGPPDGARREGGPGPLGWLRAGRPGPALALAALAFLAGSVGWSLADYYPARRLVDDYQTVVAYLRAHARPGDAVVLNSDRDWPIYLYSAPALPRSGVGSLEPISPAGAAELLAPLLARHESLWLLTSDNAYDSDPAGHVPAWLGRHARLVGEVAGPRRRLALYSTDPARSVERPASVSPGRVRLADFPGGPRLLGYDLPVRELAPGEELRLALWWQARDVTPGDAQATFRLLDQRGRVYREARLPLQPAYPPARWRPGEVTRADYALPLPRALPPGVYALAVGVSNGGRELAAVGAGAGLGVALAEVRLVGSGAPAAAGPAPQQPTDLTLGGRIRLRGYDLALAPGGRPPPGLPSRAELARETAIRLRLYWESLEAVDRPYTVFVQLVGPATNPATGNPLWAQRDAQPQGGQRPTDGWVPGEVVADDYELVVPAAAPAGTYRVQVGLYDLSTGQRLAVSAGGAPAGDAVVLLEGVVR